jgi:hypothetical protein
MKIFKTLFVAAMLLISNTLSAYPYHHWSHPVYHPGYHYGYRHFLPVGPLIVAGIIVGSTVYHPYGPVQVYGLPPVIPANWVLVTVQVNDPTCNCLTTYTAWEDPYGNLYPVN